MCFEWNIIPKKDFFYIDFLNSMVCVPEMIFVFHLKVDWHIHMNYNHPEEKPENLLFVIFNYTKTE